MGTDYQAISVSQFQTSWNIRLKLWNICQKLWIYCEIYLDFNSNSVIFVIVNLVDIYG